MTLRPADQKLVERTRRWQAEFETFGGGDLIIRDLIAALHAAAERAEAEAKLTADVIAAHDKMAAALHAAAEREKEDARKNGKLITKILELRATLKDIKTVSALASAELCRRAGNTKAKEK